MDIAPDQSTLSVGQRVSSSLSRSSSQIARRAGLGAKAKQLKPFATEDIKILLLENINQTGRDLLSQQGYQVEIFKTSFSEDELIKRIR